MSTAKTEEPTPQRLRELRKKGEVPLSRELDRSAALIGALLATVAVAPRAVELLAALFERAATGADPNGALVAAGAALVATALPIVGAAAVAAAAMGAVQTGLVFAPSRVLPQSERFKPGQAWTNKFRFEVLVTGTIALVATCLAAVVAYVGVRRLAAESPDLAAAAARGGAAEVAGALLDTFVVVGGAWLGIAAVVTLIDAAWQRHAFLRQHRMSLQEIRDQYKRSEGDPQHKARRARAHKELLAGDWRSGVKRADVVVVNPTHLAIGLRYRPDEVDAPVVTATGRGEAAKAIKREARRQGVPEYADRTCARAIVDLEVGDEVPESLFEPVAVIFRWLSTLDDAQEGDR